MKYRFLFLFLILMISLSGCSKNVSVSGKVTFEDGSPLKIGSVVFENATMSARGELNENGEYKLGSTKESNGLPKGEYKVFIVGAVEEIIDDSASDSYEGNSAMSGQMTRSTKELIDSKFKFPEKSGLSCSVQGKTTFDITVTPAN